MDLDWYRICIVQVRSYEVNVKTDSMRNLDGRADNGMASALHQCDACPLLAGHGRDRGIVASGFTHM